MGQKVIDSIWFQAIPILLFTVASILSSPWWAVAIVVYTIYLLTRDKESWNKDL